MKTRINLLSSPRTPHLKKIWSDLCREKTVPQLDRWISLRLKQDKRFGSKDRRYYADSVFSLMRYALALGQVQSLEPVKAWEYIRSLEAQDFFQAIEDLSEQTLDGPQKGGFSDWFSPRIEERKKISGWSEEDEERFLSLQMERAPFWLRLNREGKRSELEQELNRLEVPFERHELSYKILQEKNLSASRIMTDGLAEVQDFGSQMLVSGLKLKPNATVWDACAGGGGKTLQLASLYPKAEIFASDVRAYKSAEVQKRAERARLTNVKTLSWNGSAELQKPRSARDGFDLILVDAPCSGSGTFRRSPDGRFRLSSEMLKELQDLQGHILRNVLPHLKPEGEIIYATCSWFVEENEAVTEKAARELGLTILDEGLKGLPMHDSDTLFASRLKRKN